MPLPAAPHSRAAAAEATEFSMPLSLLLPSPLLLLLRRWRLPLLAQQVALPPRLGPRRDAVGHVVDDGGTVHGRVEIRGSNLRALQHSQLFLCLYCWS